MNVEALSAVVFTSADPERLAGFYRQHLGIPFAHEHHGPMRDHLEAQLGDIHFAVLKGRGAEGERGPVAPTFRVTDLDGWLASLERAGVAPLHAVAELGQGKRLASFRDVDGNVFRLIDVGEAIRRGSR